MDKLSDFQMQLNAAAAPPMFMEQVTYGELDSVPLDQQAIQDFNFDPKTGMPCYDITALIRSSKLDQRAVLANLEEFKADFLPEDISDEDALKYSYPYFAQMPSELAEYTEKITRLRIEDELRAKGVKDDEELERLLNERLDEIKKKKDEIKTE